MPLFHDVLEQGVAAHDPSASCRTRLRAVPVIACKTALITRLVPDNVFKVLVSIGAAGIPHAGLVMMTIILSAVGLPLEAAAMIWAIDRILDMARTTVHVWSDITGAAIIATTEKEIDPPRD